MTTPGTEQNKGNRRYYSLDFWRGVACLMVVVFHSTFYITDNPAHLPQGGVTQRIFHCLSLGWVGVPIFFVISGYCISAACDAIGNRGATGRFFTRRFKRIFPPYWIILVGLVALHWIPQLFGHRDLLTDAVVPMISPSSLAPSQWFGSITLTELWRDHLFGAKAHLLLGPAWSLCYEEQFYVICGLALFLGWKSFYRALAALSAVVLVMVVVNYGFAKLPIEGFFFDGHWLMFAAGVLVFYTAREMKDHKKPLILLGVALLLTLLWVKSSHENFGKEMAVSLGFAVVIILLRKMDLKIATAWLLRPVTLCGIMCYSLYLIHWPIVKIISQIMYRAGVTGEWATLLFTIPLCVACSICLAWAFHLAVERRFMNTLPVRAPALNQPLTQNINPPTVEGLPSVVKPEA